MLLSQANLLAALFFWLAAAKAPATYPKKNCDHARNKHLCLPQSYSKFELPFPDVANVVEIGIDISDVLMINDKVSACTFCTNLRPRG